MSGSSSRKGIFLALGAYFIWGVAPVYFKLIATVASDRVLAHRVIWSFIFMLVLVTIFRNWSRVKQCCRSYKNLLILGITAVVIACNWLIFIWAVSNNHMLEASLGYFINPLVNILLGMLFLGERFRPMQWCAVLLALIGVLIQLWQYGSIPFVALALAFTFSLYGLLRKKINVDAQSGMLIETFWLLPVAVLYLFLFAENTDTSFSHNDWSLYLLLAGLGILTTVPLLLFTSAARYLRLSTLGFFQYIGPTLMFLLAVVVYGEPFGGDKLITFSFIWAALGLFILDALYIQRKLR